MLAVPRAEKSKGGLRLDSAAAIAAGGDSGPVVVPGKPGESRLIEAIRYAGELKMPPKGKLSDAEIAELTEWVRAGADLARYRDRHRPVARASLPSNGHRSSPPNRKRFWAFQPPRDPASARRESARLADVAARSVSSCPSSRKRD